LSSLNQTFTSLAVLFPSDFNPIAIISAFSKDPKAFWKEAAIGVDRRCQTFSSVVFTGKAIYYISLGLR
jgi:hypothetical protein